MLCWFFYSSSTFTLYVIIEKSKCVPTNYAPHCYAKCIFRAVAAIMKYLFWNSFGFRFTFLKGKKISLFFLLKVWGTQYICIHIFMRKYKRKNHTTSLWNREKSLNFFYIASYTFYTLANINHLSRLFKYSAGTNGKFTFFANRKSIKCVVYYVKICHQVLNNVSNSLKRKKKVFFKQEKNYSPMVMVWQRGWGNQISYFSRVVIM